MNYFIKLIQYPDINHENNEFFLRNLIQKQHPASFNLLFYLNLIFTIDLRKIYSQLNIPVYCLLGENDAILPSKKLKIALENLNANHSVQIIPHASHASFVTHPTCFTTVLNEIII